MKKNKEINLIEEEDLFVIEIINKAKIVVKKEYKKYENQMIEIKIKPISINEAYTGRRFKTEKYKVFKRLFKTMLKNGKKVPEGNFYIVFEFGFSSVLSDWDSAIKNTQDVLQDIYKFNDVVIIGGWSVKKKVEKGNEYIKFMFITENEKELLTKKINETL